MGFFLGGIITTELYRDCNKGIPVKERVEWNATRVLITAKYDLNSWFEGAIIGTDV